MISALPPLPLGGSVTSASFPRSPVHPPFPRPAQLPHQPRRPLEILPFGELENEPPIPAARPIPPLRTDSSAAESPVDFTDQDLKDALEPLIGRPDLDASLFEAPEWEAMLRASFRRTLAEHSRGPFDRPALLDRCLWSFDALISSRSYEEILHQKIRRFRLEEVFLFDPEKLSLISFASVDPARHSSARKVSKMAHALGLRMRDSVGAISLEFPSGDGRRALVRVGRRAHLVALVRGEPDDLVKSDLDYALRRIESRFSRELEFGSPLLQEVQPFLEECLLIHSPIAPGMT